MVNVVSRVAVVLGLSLAFYIEVVRQWENSHMNLINKILGICLVQLVPLKVYLVLFRKSRRKKEKWQTYDEQPCVRTGENVMDILNAFRFSISHGRHL